MYVALQCPNLHSELAKLDGLYRAQTSGMSRELFDQLCDDPKSAVIIPGYMVKGTFSESVGATYSKGQMIPTLSGDMKPFNIRVECAFSGVAPVLNCAGVLTFPFPFALLVMVYRYFLLRALRLQAVFGPDYLN